jgi:dTDP-4-amino-4,6-dideoxygalactose transaminase
MIDYLPLKRITAMHADEIHEAILRVVDGGWYLRGEATAQFEQQYARYIGTKYCIGVGNGLDALTLILRAYKEIGVLKEGDEVIVPANTYIATILAITENRLVPVLVEPDIDTLQIDESRIGQAVTSRTRAVMLVHLYGRCSYTETIGALCRQHDLLLLEDNAQAHGCCFKGRRTGSLGMAAGHSFYPGKNLGALGDAGAVTTSDDRLAEVVRSMANYGSSRKYVFDYQGCNSRLDEIQAAVLSVKLKYLDDDNARRQAIADYYIKHVKNPLLRLPEPSGSVFHVFPVLCEQRDRLQQYLAENGVATVVHYPIPPHKQACYEKWHDICLPITEQIHAQELSIPCHQAMTSGEVETVTDIINRFTN